MKTIQLMVAFAAEVPDDCDIEDLSLLSLSIPLECIYVKHNNRLLDHCRVTGYEIVDVDDSEDS